MFYHDEKKHNQADTLKMENEEILPVWVFIDHWYLQHAEKEILGYVNLFHHLYLFKRVWLHTNETLQTPDEAEKVGVVRQIREE